MTDLLTDPEDCIEDDDLESGFISTGNIDLSHQTVQLAMKEEAVSEKTSRSSSINP